MIFMWGYRLKDKSETYIKSILNSNIHCPSHTSQGEHENGKITTFIFSHLFLIYSFNLKTDYSSIKRHNLDALKERKYTHKVSSRFTSSQT